MYYTACLLLTIQLQLLCQAIVGLFISRSREGLLKIFWGGGGGGGDCTSLTSPRFTPALGLEVSHGLMNLTSLSTRFK